MTDSLHTNGPWKILFLLALFFQKMDASKLDVGFRALGTYDYFKAKKIFSEINASRINVYASYGLATLYSRNDNPFFNADSAGKYVLLSYNCFVAAPGIAKIGGFLIDAPSILKLCDSIVAMQLRRLKKEISPSHCDLFLRNYYLADKRTKSHVVYLRDELEFNLVLTINRSDTTDVFLLTHPQSEFLAEARLLKNRQLYDEITADNTSAGYKRFLQRYPHSAMANSAYEKLFQIYRQHSDIKGLREFVVSYPASPQTLEAWKLLFSLSVRSFSSNELTKFLEEYPDFPLRSSIIRELELNNLVLFPYHEKDLSGFINAQGLPIIRAEYDSVTNFYEGLSVVSKNDSVFYINKENENPFHRAYSDAYVFRHGIAAVKQDNSWNFINRQGQVISRLYEEVNDLSDGAYVLRLGSKYGAVDQFGQNLIDPRFYKLGDFKNGYAYYVDDGKYGFISKRGYQHRAEFEWISDFERENIAVFKQNNKYGLILSSGKRLLEPRYDQILRAPGGLFILVSNGSYGFFSSEDCLLSPIVYDFEKDKPADYYTDGKLLKLLRKSEQSLVDKNGKVILPFGSYAEINFFSEGLLLAKKMGKRDARYGYLDGHLNQVISFKYDAAQSFSDSAAVVVLKGKFALIDMTGAEIFVSEQTIDKLSRHYYRVNGEAGQIIDRQGKVIFVGLRAVSHPEPSLLIIQLNNGEIKLLYD